jgi:hypothetical protein
MKTSIKSAITAVALATAAAVPAFAHDVIIPRAGFDTALAAAQMDSPQGQAASASQASANAQGQTGSVSTSDSEDYVTTANHNDASDPYQNPLRFDGGWWKTR